MSRMTLRGIDQEARDKIIKKPKKKALPANSLKTLAGGWSRKEADEFFESLEPFNSNRKTPKE